ncbi:MAG: hypothetical protein HRT54_12160 [Colwellia sp.]|nr:hypothetical protein [Colwellia sp.]
MNDIGLGCTDFTIAVYIGNKPNMPEYQQLTHISPLTSGEINAINQACGNGWRKVFNVYAKLLYALDKKNFLYSEVAPTWQKYRDSFLLQPHSQTALLFSPPLISTAKESLHIICGKTYVKHLLATGQLVANLIWLDEEFAIDKTQNLVVCPYFDYRQLSNIKIEKLANLLKNIKIQ